MIEGGVDALLIETIFDTLNAKAAIVAARRSLVRAGTQLPLMISGTITDRSGRTLSGQTPAAFWQSIRHTQPLTVGLNLRSAPRRCGHTSKSCRQSPTPSSACLRSR